MWDHRSLLASVHASHSTFVGVCLHVLGCGGSGCSSSGGGRAAGPAAANAADEKRSQPGGGPSYHRHYRPGQRLRAPHRPPHRQHVRQPLDLGVLLRPAAGYKLALRHQTRWRDVFQYHLAQFRDAKAQAVYNVTCWHATSAARCYCHNGQCEI